MMHVHNVTLIITHSDYFFLMTLNLFLIEAVSKLAPEKLSLIYF